MREVCVRCVPQRCGVCDASLIFAFLHFLIYLAEREAYLSPPRWNLSSDLGPQQPRAPSCPDARKMSGVSAVSKFLALKMHNWRGQYQRVFSFGENMFQTLDPATFSVTNAWKYDDIIALELMRSTTISLPLRCRLRGYSPKK